MNKKFIFLIFSFLFFITPCFAYDETDYKTSNSYLLDFDNEDVWADLDKTVLGKTGFEHAEDVINALDDAGYDYVILIREFKRTNSAYGPNAVEIRASIFRKDELDKKNLYLSLGKYTSYSQLRLNNGTKKINYYNMDFNFYETSLSQSPSLEEQMKKLKKIYDDYSKGYWNVDQPARLLAEWSDTNFPNPDSGDYLIYYSNLNLKFDTSKFDKDLIIKINNRDYSVKNDEVSQSMLSYRNFKNGYINLQTDPKPKITLKENKIEKVDDVDIIKSSVLTFDFDKIDYKKYGYFYSVDDGMTWQEYKGEQPTFDYETNLNTTLKIRILDKEQSSYVSETKFIVDFIGVSKDYYQEYLKEKYEKDLSNDEVTISWKDGPLGLVKYWSSLFEEKFPIFKQMEKIFKTLTFDPSNNPYCVSAAGVDVHTGISGHYFVCPYIPSLSLKQFGIDKNFDVIDPIFWRENKETVFFWIKLVLGIITLAKLVKNVEKVVNHE